MKNLIIADVKKSYTKIVIMLVLLVLTKVSCQESATLAPESDEQVNLEEAITNKLGPNPSKTLQAWGITMEEFEAALYAGHNASNNEVKTTSRSLSALSPLAPPVWETDYGTGVNMGDDDCKSTEIGFPFTFYGNTFSKLWVNSNGNVTFDGCNTRFWPTNIPDHDSVYVYPSKVIIAPIYGDFNPSVVDSDVYVNTIGTEPNRTFVVTWLDVPAYGWSGVNTFQVQLAEGSNSILFGYNGLTTTGTNEINGYTMNVGISADTIRYINSATAEEIPELDMTNICYSLEDGEYQEIFGACGSKPVASAGPDQTVECAGESTAVSLDGTGSSDPNGDPLTYSWGLDGNEIATGATPSINLPMGSHSISLTVTDASGAYNSDEVIVDIVDTTVPELTYTVHTTQLWPPNGDMHLSVSGIFTSDVCDPNPALSVTVIDSHNGGNTNWDIVENDDGTIDVYLRAEKSSNGDRTYTVVITSEDASGNVVEEAVEVNVPQSMGRGRRGQASRS